MNNCPKCGSPLDYNAHFCTSCGANIKPGGTMPPRPVSPFDKELAERERRQNHENSMQPESQPSNRPPFQPIARPPTNQKPQQPPQPRPPQPIYPDRRPPINTPQRPTIAGHPVQNRPKIKKQRFQNEGSRRKIGAVVLIVLVLFASTLVFLNVTGFGGILGDRSKFVAGEDDYWKVCIPGSSMMYGGSSSIGYHLYYNFKSDGTVIIEIISESFPKLELGRSNQNKTIWIKNVESSLEEEEESESGTSTIEKAETSIEANWYLKNNKLYIEPMKEEFEKNYNNLDFSFSQIYLRGFEYQIVDNDRIVLEHLVYGTVSLVKTSGSEIKQQTASEFYWRDINITIQYSSGSENFYNNIEKSGENVKYSGLHAPNNWGRIEKGDEIIIPDGISIYYIQFWYRPLGKSIGGNYY